ncbi:hypothetical protein BGW38_010003, partial [Lunasporangiospora selenospora]
MSLNVNILPVFEQLQLYDELMSLAFICPQAQMFDENMKRIGVRSNEGLKERLGYDYVVFSRPKLYELLLSKVPSHRILFGKKVLSIQHALGDTCHTVSLKCSDNSTYDGDILVGADGAYSAVRQSLYRSLDAMKKLPPKDAQGLRIGYLTLVGTTDPMDDEKMAELKDNFSHFAMVIGSGKPYTWSVFTIPEKRVCWTVQVQIAESTAEERAFRNTEWGPESNEAMIREVSDFSTPFGPLGRFIEATPRDRISKVFLEEKLFETWHSGRTVLIGDAAHKMLPAAGQGAVNAMQDSVILANCLYDIANCPTTENITAAFRDYQEQRFSHVKFQFESSKFQAKILFGQTFGERMLRQVVFGFLECVPMEKRLWH